ncbi:MAG: type II secretion system protein [Planctomycetaceae bacterium]
MQVRSVSEVVAHRSPYLPACSSAPFRAGPHQVRCSEASSAPASFLPVEGRCSVKNRRTQPQSCPGSRQGFTLIELLVVIAIIAILLSKL